jgi:prepilin-type processing-associated H-X9-DG protein
LVELLVVIGIIAVLIGILVPTLIGARRSAMAARCAVSLRELGIATQMYANEYNGYARPWRCGSTKIVRGAGDGIYDLYGIKYGFPTFIPGESSLDSAYWYNFLAKYLTEYKGGTAQNAKTLEEFRKGPVWGCPAFAPLPDTQHAEITTEFNPLLVGYAWNPHPAFTPTHPAAGAQRPTETSRQVDSVGKCGVSSITNFAKLADTSGRWIKLKQYTRPAERALIADVESWILEAKPPPLNGVLPGQKLHYGKPDFAPAAAGQGATTFDWYRHGKPPAVQVMGDAGYYKKEGGPVAYNILYVDGHVDRAIDRETSYRSVRMRFPG